jgi:LuxR family transcriptional regulator, quorum-sensing system regulator BjaR1
MTKAAQTFGREAFEFVENLDRQPNPEAVIQAMNRVVARFGFEGLFVSWLRASPSRPFDDLVLAAQCPSEFRAVYASKGYVRFDPNVRRALSSDRPFEWTLSSGESRERRVREVMRFLADFGFKRGFVVPIHGAGGLEAGVGMVGDKLDLPAEAKPGLHLMALYAFDRVCQLVGTEAEETPSLTKREREVLAWSAQGKSAWEIGELLHLTKRTVDEHARTAMRKLGAANRTHAVAIAIRRRLFEI